MYPHRISYNSNNSFPNLSNHTVPTSLYHPIVKRVPPGDIPPEKVVPENEQRFKAKKIAARSNLDGISKYSFCKRLKSFLFKWIITFYHMRKSIRSLNQHLPKIHHRKKHIRTKHSNSLTYQSKLYRASSKKGGTHFLNMYFGINGTICFTALDLPPGYLNGDFKYHLSSSKRDLYLSINQR